MDASPIPEPRFDNLLAADPIFAALSMYWLKGGHVDDVLPLLARMGRAAAEATPLAREADHQRPQLVTENADGQTRQRVQYHPSYAQLERLAYGNGVVGTKYDLVFLNAHRDVRHLTGFAMGYLFAQTECGLFCPICMTDGVARVLERHAADNPIAQRALRHLAATDADNLWQGAMFLTEKQGGSDVGANTVEATERDGRWFLSGDKWFCSNVDAEAILALARMPGHGPETGTEGLGLFLVLRHEPTDNGASIEIHRLKDKLGVASMPTGECTFHDTEAHLIGGAGSGFKQMADMLNLSRLYNSVAALGIMRRATMEALAYGRARQAFGQPLDSLPLWRATMADLIAETLGATLLVFDTVRALDAADGGDEEAEQVVRLLTPAVKTSTAALSVFIASQAMEAIGGNAYIEDHIMPRLLRDAQVLPIWEGTGNILALDALRVLKRTQASEILIARMRAAVDAAPDSLHANDGAFLEGLHAEITRLDALGQGIAQADASDAQRAVRGWSELVTRAHTKALCMEAARVPGLQGVFHAVAQRLHARAGQTVAIAGTYSALLEGTEQVLLDAFLPDLVA